MGYLDLGSWLEKVMDLCYYSDEEEEVGTLNGSQATVYNTELKDIYLASFI